MVTAQILDGKATASAIKRELAERVAKLAEQGVIQEWIADSRIEIEQARLLTMKTAWLMDTVGNKGARVEVAAIKVAVPEMALKVIDRAIQAHGGGGVSADFPLASMYAHIRTLRLADGPGPNRISMRVEGSVYLGDHWEYWLRHEDLTLRAVGDSPLGAERVWCECPKDHLWIFPDSDRR